MSDDKGEKLWDQAYISYPVAVAADGKDGLIASFQERLIVLSPIKAGVFECSGWIITK